ncbi:LacI family DNA-binding transcriptional regulator [Companilactobacillus huachuanensis]|uniref:LacI family DNA-binding transcriptional regulator n=1 Tax=Companilactobacillus huachuanensis TaxID=2559914 RepID=A0ABW1RQC5_9LACO|nr:LacI family DNA-binding transcriptional regulator [Companilactobacillus huachuanensis]
MNKEITIKDIARMAGVSVSTVSRVINNKPNVTPLKKSKVQQAIKESGFQPSMLARGMISNKTNTLGIIVPDITNAYFTALISQIELITRGLNYSLLLFNTMTAGKQRSNDSVSTEIEVFHTIQEKKVDGVIILGGEIDKIKPDQLYIKALNQLNEQIPVVIVGQPNSAVTCKFVPRYQEMSGEIITQHLLASGYQNIGFLGGEPDVEITDERLQGYKKMMSTYSNLDSKLIYLNDYYVQDGYDGMSELIKKNLKIDALVTINDQVALGAIRALNDNDLRCPQDIAIGSCDAFPNSAYFTPRLTTIDHHNITLAKIAVKYLIQLIEPKGHDSFQSDSPLPELIIRESCGHKLKEENNDKS